jgi:hypothetical protein
VLEYLPVLRYSKVYWSIMIDTVRVTVKLSSYWLSSSQVTSSGDLRVCEFPNGRLIPRDDELPSIEGS